MFCTNCGQENDDNANFCRKCGNNLKPNYNKNSEKAKFANGNSRNKKRGSDVYHDLQITLEEAFNGISKDIKITHSRICPKCKGTKASPESIFEICSNCGGTGQVKHVKKTLLGRIARVQPCSKCKGDGKIIINPCSKCHGRGYIKERGIITVNIPAGVDDGSKLRIAGKGIFSRNNSSPGDLYVNIHIKQHELFERDGANLYVVMPINFTQAKEGGIIEVPTLHNNVELKIPAGTQTETVFRLKDCGMPIINSNDFGNLYVLIKIVNSQK